MKNIFKIVILCILIAGMSYAAIPLSNRTWIRVGSLQSPFDAWGAERGWDANYSIYEGLLWPAWYNRSDNFVIDRQFMVCRNFTDPGGNVLNYKSAKFSSGASATQVIPQLLTQVGKYPYCDISVDGVTQYVDDYLGDNIDPDLPADRIVTNTVRTGMGVDMTRKVYAFSQTLNDNYFIYEYTFTNTGNTDDDADIELTNTINEFYFGLMSRYCTSREVETPSSLNLRTNTWGAHQWVYHTPMSDNPDIPYFYTWFGQLKTADITIPYNNVGHPYIPAEGSVKNARIRSPQFAGQGVLHVDKAYNDETYDKSKVRTGWYIGDTFPPEGDDAGIWNLLTTNYQGMGNFDVPQDVGVSHKIADRFPPNSLCLEKGDGAGTNSYLSFGPFDIPHGESIKIVFCEGVSGLSREKAIEVGKKWYLAYQGNTVDLDLPGPSPYRAPEAISETATAYDIYKDSWVYTGKDSIIQTFIRAKENYDSDFGIPLPPPPPVSFSIAPQPDMITIEWADNPEEDPDFEGYRLYRAMLAPDSFYHCIFDGNVTEGTVANQYYDKNLLRGINYYYYISAYKIDPVSGNRIESGRAYTQTTIPTSLKKPPRDVTDDDVLIADIARDYAAGLIGDKERIHAVLGMIRVVPNPFNIRNRTITFGETTDKDKLMFYNLPGNCTIRIFTERGDLVKVIEHETREGMAAVADEAWYSNTDSRQVVKSGVYIAHIQVSKDTEEPETGLPLLFKGDSIIKKFIVIR
ncbi:MAG: hypothetical protein PHX07_03120 [Candidatus Marinimicrobia bacterium]|nr:hypothetical protein [Candidatus Neomarinimicrobiota bacterium]MDD4961209.1 hypothetical protein [Candidatus Neomarinimicrobiota bacterium]MDD5709901.1 hypothetical protein [Candidatus Neomarinimicrobiota bacterium]